MTDATPTPDPDDVLRQALQAEVDGVEASDALLDRTLDAASRPAVRPNRRLLAVAAVAAAVAIGAGVALARDDDQKVESADDLTTSTTSTTAPADRSAVLTSLFPCQPGDVVRLSILMDASEPVERVTDPLRADERASEVVTASPEEVAAAGGGEGSAASATFASREDELAVRGEVSDLPGVAATSTTDCGGAPVTPTGGRPTTVALVREDGWLVIADLETGEQRELYFGGDPNAPSAGQEEGGPQFIDSVELSPAGGFVYFSMCCEPASGITFRMPLEGGEPEQVALGAHPRVSPDGRYLATATGESILVTDTDTGEVVSTPVACCVRRFGWSPVGPQLAAMRIGSAEQPAELLLFDWDGASLTAADPGRPDNAGRFLAWDPNGRLTTVGGGGSTDSYRSLSQDVSFAWLLWVDGEGVVREQASLHSGELPAIAGLPKALTADW
jgi:hypothetical protein